MLRKLVGRILANIEGLAAASRQSGHPSDLALTRHDVQRTVEAPDFSCVLERFGGTK